VIYLHTIHAISYQRLSALMLAMFGVSISAGTIANILARAKAPVDAAVANITDELRRAEVIGCDETGARVAVRKYWQWVFGCATAVLHKVAASRGKAVVREVLGKHVPAVWVSDRFAAQTGHGESWQLCLAHLLRDAQPATPCSPHRSRSSCCARSTSPSGGRCSRTTPSTGTDVASTGTLTTRSRGHRTAAQARSCVGRSGASAVSCSYASPTAGCRRPTTPASAICARLNLQESHSGL
jgi:hypothetical protein